MGGNIPGGNFLGRNFPGGNFPGGSLMGGNFPGGNFTGGNFPRTQKCVSMVISNINMLVFSFLLILHFFGDFNLILKTFQYSGLTECVHCGCKHTVLLSLK